jgi:choline dehydrogenase-like flavoprotein
LSEITETQRSVLAALCDAVVPPVAHDPDPDGFFARKASDVGVPAAVEQMLTTAVPPEQRAGLLQLLDALADQGFARSSQRSREQILRNVALTGPEPAAGVQALMGLTLFLYYGLPDARGQNPNWKTFGYPGPPAAAGPQGSPGPDQRPIEPFVPDGDTTLEADVCVVGSGAGGGVMAGCLSERGLKVVVLEAGGYFDDADFLGLEIPAYQNLYWRGGPTPTADLNVSLQAGSCLGGGTVINWTNSLRTTPWVREQWEREYGLEGLAGSEFDRHLDAVWERISVNDRCSELNAAHQRMKAGAEALGWHFALANRNVDERRYTFETAGHIGFGDRTGAKQSTAKTYLRDAYDRGAVLVARCAAERVLVENGRAAGVEGVWIDPQSGRSARVAVRAPQVVVAAGALESPALLLRSGIGGPAVGEYLRLHPCTATFAYYPQEMENWKGAPHAAVIHEFEDLQDGYGFLIEGAHFTTAIAGSALPFTTAGEHKRTMADFRHGCSLIALLRDRGHGRVTIDRAGMSVPTYALTDELDRRNMARGIEAQLRLHQAAGAMQIAALAVGAPTWRWGDDLGAFTARVQQIPLRAGGWTLFSAHQMSTCRMGVDPATSVAGPWGELHDVQGVWIGDGSAFPTSSGTNPMITIMALAHRNAEAVAAAAPATAGAAGAPAGDGASSTAEATPTTATA